MIDISAALQNGGNVWFLAPSAVLLGALHGLEPGHSKSMMAAFIIAVRGTVVQAVMLGLAATISHTAVVWLIALGGMYFGAHWAGEASEAYLQLVSAGLILTIALWMAWRTWRSGRRQHVHTHDHDHGCDHGHDHDDADGDAHARAHAAEIRTRFASGSATTGQILMFGLTGGLIPCPASITVLLICLQLKQVTLGAALVLCFSLGLAATLVAVGVVAAIGVRAAAGRWRGFSDLTRRAPYFSSALMLAVGLYTALVALGTLKLI